MHLARLVPRKPACVCFDRTLTKGALALYKTASMQLEDLNRRWPELRRQLEFWSGKPCLLLTRRWVPASVTGIVLPKRDCTSQKVSYQQWLASVSLCSRLGSSCSLSSVSSVSVRHWKTYWRISAMPGLFYVHWIRQQPTISKSV